MSKFKIGWSEVSITPDKKVSLAGQFYERISEYVETPITATAMAIEGNGDHMVICACDITSVGSNLMHLVRDGLKDVSGLKPENVIINATHTHTSIKYTSIRDVREQSSLDILNEFMPEEKSYKKLVEDGILERKARHDLINYYARAAVNLYGVIRQEELASIFNSQNKEALTENKMFDALLKQIYFYSNYCFWEDYIVHDEFEDGDFKEVSMLLNEIGNKPRYIPVKEEFLRYADDDYFEKTKEIQALRAFFIKESGVDASVADEILIEIHYAFLVQTGLQKVFDILENYTVFIDENKFNKLVELITQCSNNTRLWENNGHTPNELFKINKKG